MRLNEKMKRRHLPNSYEIDCMNNCRRDVLNVALNAEEAVHVRAFTREQLSALITNVSQEKEGYVEFCKKNKSFSGVFYPQIFKGTMLTKEQIEAIDSIQDVRESDIRLLFQRGVNVELGEFLERVKSFKKKFQGKRNIAVIDVHIPMMDIDNLALLSDKLDVLVSDFDEIVVIYRGRITYKKVWNLVAEKLSGNSWGVFEVPTKSDNGFCLEAFCFTKGAEFTCHYRSLIGRRGEPKFLNTNFKLSALRNADSGIQLYGNLSRKNLVENSLPETSLSNFSKWDRIVQLNKLCETHLNVKDIEQVRAFQEAHRHFTQ